MRWNWCCGEVCRDHSTTKFWTIVRCWKYGKKKWNRLSSLALTKKKCSRLERRWRRGSKMVMNEWMNEWMNKSIFHNSKLQNLLLKVSLKFKIHFLQFTNMRIFLTARKLTGNNTYSDVSYRKHFFTNWFFKRSLVCNTFSSYMIDVNEEYVKERCCFLEKKTLERRMTGEFLLYQKVR